MSCKHWWIENWKIGPISERWAECPYCGDRKEMTSGPKKKQDRRKGG